ncbi:sialate O-acetylesterase [Carboxylicivirga mesophila]|uniref:Sialate O-acetylesterase n=1 Tax=Carboxylicivirga mesophila TaxID=1166478 RepID=A0ABS5K8U9_9BACT|nr:sialate O-acetylesterase [Carboxylicivirga mesophila]MBS2211302.1 sialate O-acetylesterase [Carboxylicivirga mesophila]
MNKVITILIAIVFSNFPGKADVKLADVFSDNMVLQRNLHVNVWGSAEPGEKVMLSFNGQKLRAKADKTGEWQVVLEPMKAGGPFIMIIKGKNELVLKNILIGDVWVCSGQSNMQWPVSKSINAEEEIKAANYPSIRLFDVPRSVSNVPVDSIPNAKWKECSPEMIKNFSAVGYYFGRDLQKEIDLPIGLIHTSWGGTCAETWTSRAFITKLPKYEEFGERIDNYDVNTVAQKYEDDLKKALGGFPEKEVGMAEQWMKPDTDRSEWLSMTLPTLWENAGYNRLNGRVWFSFDCSLTELELDSIAQLHLGQIHDSDIIWVNGVKVGGMNWANEVERVYPVPVQLLKTGQNNITVRVEDKYYKGGFASKADKMFFQLGEKKIPLSGDWQFKVDTVIPDFNPFPNDAPSLLYNAMIHPLIPYGIKGVIWYQGESNTPRAKEYALTFPNMINNWRADWQQGDFPFLFVQLANYQQAQKMAKDDAWAELRESQTKTLGVKNTGMAVAIDIGEAHDIHPKNKQDVGHRLMLSALNVAYAKDVVYSGPLFKSMQIDGDKAIISFDHVGSGLLVKSKHGYVNEFEMAGEDKQFHWAQAQIEGNKVIVWSDNVDQPVAVRFAWSRNPSKFNLYNKEGLPASPFRTDDWEGVTDGKSFDD